MRISDSIRRGGRFDPDAWPYRTEEGYLWMGGSPGVEFLRVPDGQGGWVSKVRYGGGSCRTQMTLWAPQELQNSRWRRSGWPEAWWLSTHRRGHGGGGTKTSER
jgi:hypothetical protein